MKEKEINALLEELKLSKTGIGWTIKGDEAYKTAEEIICRHINKSKTLKKITLLETKISVYEKIISKSNFSAIIS